MSNGLHERLREAGGSKSYRHIGELTNTHPETVRRYMQGQAPAVEFIAAFAHAMGLNLDWLLTGRGPMKASEVKAYTLSEANASELLTAMANTIEDLITRVERLELFLNTLESRVRAAWSPPASSSQTDRPPPHHASAATADHGQAQAKPDATLEAKPVHAADRRRAGSIADALPGGPRADARGTPPARGA
ncbi:MAG: hypothetical protein AB7Q00_01750 [Phycisphaerales bacterium]